MVLVNVAKIVFIVDILVPLSPGSGKDSHIPTSSPTHDIIKMLHLGAIWGKENTASISQMNKEPQATEALCLRKGSKGFPGGASGKEPACQCRRHRSKVSIPGSGRSPGGGHGNPLQYSCLENPMDRGAWQAAVHGVTKSQTRLKRLSTHACT